ncbi:hypothetical protein HDV01_003245 [Terramyces sp. JEL0728]|nr:hypothetical protein HDV01_003245 [Terramyces sp. JEL0728]
MPIRYILGSLCKYERFLLEDYAENDSHTEKYLKTCFFRFPPMPKTILVIGATGATGKHFMAHSLEKGFITRAIVRDPSKIPKEHQTNANFQVVKGSFTDAKALEEALHDGKVDYIVVMAGDPKQKTPFMEPFIKSLVPLMKKYNTKRILYQAGAFSCKPGETISFVGSILLNTVALGIGIKDQILDNDKVIEYLASEKDIEWIVVRAGMIVEKPSKGKIVLNASWPAQTGVSFTDLALFNLEAVQDEKLLYTCDFPNYS